jgi:hypothetical protein
MWTNERHGPGPLGRACSAGLFLSEGFVASKKRRTVRILHRAEPGYDTKTASRRFCDFTDRCHRPFGTRLDAKGIRQPVSRSPPHPLVAPRAILRELAASDSLTSPDSFGGGGRFQERML